jgi:lysophospholipase L1-like esterase
MSDLKRIQTLFARPEPVTWLFTGDSITHGAFHTFGWRSYPEHFAERVRWELQRRREVVINTGISGDTAPGLAADLDHRILRFRPHVVSIMMGMNDATAGPPGLATFESAYRDLIARIRTSGDVLILLHTQNTVFESHVCHSNLPGYVDAIRRMAGEFGAALVDHYAIWSDRTTPVTSILEDAIHPNHFGHILFAHSLFRVLQIDDPGSPTCRLFVP